MTFQIFEPRYRQMVTDLLDTAGRLVVAMIDDRVEIEGSAPRVHAIAGLGEICGHEALPDGRYLIAVFGLTRVRLTEVERDTPYRQVDVEVLDETPVPDPEAAGLRCRLAAAIDARNGKPAGLPGDAPVARLVDLLLGQIPLGAAQKQSIFAVTEVETRARLTLEACERLPGPPAES